MQTSINMWPKKHFLRLRATVINPGMIAHGTTKNDYPVKVKDFVDVLDKSLKRLDELKSAVQSEGAGKAIRFYFCRYLKHIARNCRVFETDTL